MENHKIYSIFTTICKTDPEKIESKLTITERQYCGEKFSNRSEHELVSLYKSSVTFQLDWFDRSREITKTREIFNHTVIPFY